MRKAIQKSLLTFFSSQRALFSCFVFTLVMTGFLSYSYITQSASHFPLYGATKESNDLYDIDVVYTWVNGSDPLWREKFLSYSNIESKNNLSDTTSENRFRDLEELRYSLRSLELYAPWIRKVYLVTDNQIPYWLNLNNKRIQIVSHSEIFPNASHLPSFSSPAIESHLHRIHGLSKRFLYFNDDVFLGKPIHSDDFITSRGQRVYFSWDVPKCAPGCISTWIGDGFCDKACNVTSCLFDKGDCSNFTSSDERGRYSSSRWNPSGSAVSAPTQCAPNCPVNWLGDKICDKQCNSEACAFDGLDCDHTQLNSTFVYDLSKIPLQSANVSSNEFSLDIILPLNHSSYVIPFNMSIPTLLNAKIKEVFYRSNTNNILTVLLSHFYNKMVVIFKNPNVCDTYVDGGVDQFLNEIKLVGEKVENETLPPVVVYIKIAHNCSNVLLSPGAYDQFNDTSKVNIGKERILTSKINENYLNSVKLKNLSLALLDNFGSLETSRSILKEMISVSNNLQIENDLNNDKWRRLDTFADSLVHVDMLLTSLWGSEPRKVPAHMPHLIDKDVMAKLILAFPQEWEKTSERRFRSGSDMQYAFAYFYFGVIYNSGEINYSVEDIFSLFADKDGDGYLNNNEIRTLVSLSLGKAPTNEDMHNAVSCLKGNEYSSNLMKTVTIEEVKNCSFILNGLKTNVKVVKFEKMGTEDVSFEMIEDNVNKTLTQLDNIRGKQTKFICINDNQKNSSPEQFALISSFFEAMWPMPSSFERIEGENNILRSSELNLKNDFDRNICPQWLISFLAFVLGFLIAYAAYKLFV